MKFYLNNLINIDATWIQDESIKKDSEGWYVEEEQTFEWYRKLDRAFEVLGGNFSNVNFIQYLENEFYINEWEDYIYYGELLEDVIEKGYEEWLLAYIEATDESMYGAVQDYENESCYVGYDRYALQEFEDSNLNAIETDYGWIMIK